MSAPVLSKDVRPRQLVTMAAGCMIGAAWMVMIGSWLQGAGTLGAILAFLTGLLLVVPVALCYARLAAQFPQSGGEIVYIYEAFGTKVAFAVGWLYLWICLGWSAFQIVVASWFITMLIPGFPDTVMYTVLGHDVSAGFLIVALVGTLSITRVNYKGGRVSATMQEYLTVVLLIGIVGIIIASFSAGTAANMKPLWGEGPATGQGFMALLITVPVWYSGFNAVAQALGEVRQLQARHISRIIVGTLFGTALFYMCVLVAVSYGAAPEDLAATSPALLGIFEPGSVWGPRIVLLVGLLGILTSWNFLFFVGTRLLFALSRAHMIPKPFSRVHPKFGAPHLAVVFVGLSTLTGSLSGRGILELVVNTSGICFAVIYLLVALAQVRLAKSSVVPGEKEKASGLRLGRIASVTAACMVLFAIVVTFRASDRMLPLEWSVLIVWIVAGAVTWLLGRSFRESVSEPKRRELLHMR